VFLLNFFFYTAPYDKFRPIISFKFSHVCNLFDVVSIQGKGGTSSIALSSEPITGMLFLISVDMYPLILQNTSAPCCFLKFPDIFWALRCFVWIIYYIISKIYW